MIQASHFMLIVPDFVSQVQFKVNYMKHLNYGTTTTFAKLKPLIVLLVDQMCFIMHQNFPMELTVSLKQIEWIWIWLKDFAKISQ